MSRPRTHYLMEAAMNTPTQTVYPWKAALRTFVQTIIPALLVVNLVLPQIVDIINVELGKAALVLPDWITLAVNSLIIGLSVTSAIITRIMAIPGVNAWLTKIGLGAAPNTTKPEA